MRFFVTYFKAVDKYLKRDNCRIGYFEREIKCFTYIQVKTGLLKNF